MRKSHFVLGIIIIIIDQLVKFFMIGKNIVRIPKFLQLSYTQNNGGAFGIGHKYIILVLSIIIIIGIIIFLIKNKQKIGNYLPFIFILSGSIGNLIDRVFRGYVIDYISINLFDFPRFNIADICIVIGIGCLIIKIIKNY